MKFRPVYYMISGWPSLEKTREMVRRYVEHGVTALQFDMPGADPSRESAFIQQGMRRPVWQGLRCFHGCAARDPV